MKYGFFILFMLCYTLASAQGKSPADFGYRYLQMVYKNDTVNIFIKSKKGEELKPKPLFFFAQGSLPIPLIAYNKNGATSPFPFNTDSLCVHYHLVVAGKPFIPIIVSTDQLEPDFTFLDSNRHFPIPYSQRNHLDYYVNRNIAIIKFLQKQPYINKERLVAAGHSEGSTVVAKMATVFPRITQLIYSGGNPLGRITTIVTRDRFKETDSLQSAEKDLATWKEIVDNPSANYPAHGDSYKTTFDFSTPPIQYLQKIKIPVLVCYGTKDVGAASFNDFMRIDMIRRRKTNFFFKTYIGTEHNYFYLRSDGSINYDIFNWDKVAVDWAGWLQHH